MRFYLLFWYHVFTCVSVRLREAANSILSCTLRYFCLSKLRSSWASWWSVPFFFHWAEREEERPGQGRKGLETRSEESGNAR